MSVLLFTIFLLIAIEIAIGLVVFAWRNRELPGAKPLAAFASAVALWGVGMTLVAFSPTPEDALAWFYPMYSAIAAAPIALLIIVLQLSGWANWPKPNRMVLLCAIPFIVSVITWINPDWFLQVTFYQKDGLMFSKSVIGTGFILHGVYSYSLILISIGLLARQVVRTSGIYRRQAVMLFIGVLVPVLILVAGDIGPLPELWQIILAPPALAFMGLAFAWTIYQFQLFNLVRVARSVLVNTMSDAMLILDNQHRIVDWNPASQTLFGFMTSKILNQPVVQLLPDWPDIANRLQGMTEIHAETNIVKGGNKLHYHVQVTPLADRRNEWNGWMVVMRDITLLVDANERLQTQLEEINELQTELREQALRDSLTGLHNRRYLQETLEREFTRASREGYPVCLIMLDIDYFKNVNDTFGHIAGDMVLNALADELRSQVRAGDIICRYGGDEFLLVMLNVSAEVGFQRAEKLQQSFQASYVIFENMEIRATLSLGLAAFPIHGATSDEVMRAADFDMYQAKSEGGNCVVVLPK
jgi:diguanylate cyclase (GGDEF)-like protein/PAS domain S-box-containing protein